MLPSRSSASRSTARRRPSTSGNVNSLQSPKQPPFCVFLPPSPPRTRSRSNSPRESLSWFQSRPLNPSLRSSYHTHRYGSSNRTSYKRRSASVAYRLAPTCWRRRALTRSIHLEPLTNLGHISKPELQPIYPRCLYAYVTPLDDWSPNLSDLSDPSLAI